MFGDKKLIGSSIAALCLAASAFCQNYVELVSPGGAPVFPVSINAVGAITGYFQDPPTSDFRDGFARDAGGTVTTIRVPNFFFFLTQPSGINDVGSITGNYVKDLLFDSSGFVRDPQGNITSFDPPGSVTTAPSSINAGEVITGYYTGANGVVHGFVRYADGSIISFDLPGSTSTMPLSINSNGDITGNYRDASKLVHGFLIRAGGVIVPFDPPESTGTFPVSINDGGAITGYYTAPNGLTYGFVRDPLGNFTSFSPGLYTFPTSINDEGAITGYYSDNSNTRAGHTLGFVRSPDGTITSFDPNNTEPALCSPVRPQVFPTSINQQGVITGYCFHRDFMAQGWVRYP